MAKAKTAPSAGNDTPTGADTPANENGKVRLVCTLPNASENISGIAFMPGEGGMISEEIEAAAAERFLTIEGFALLK